ncbi:hypothetical protein [Methylobacterium tarhaniae]|uniref:hypothetical protein n=1 Tax=Methylobacterium tarhaniae TaxID=1187852 RepID=UPI003D07B9AC
MQDPDEQRVMGVMAEYGFSEHGIRDAQAVEAEAEAQRATTIHNERVKITCTGINSLAVNLFTAAAIVPLVAASFPLPSTPEWNQTSFITLGVWATMAGFIHSRARAYMERML